MANRKTDAQRIVEAFSSLPLEKAEMLLEVAAGLVKTRRKADPFDTHMSSNPVETRRQRTRGARKPNGPDLSAMPDTDRVS